MRTQADDCVVALAIFAFLAIAVALAWAAHAERLVIPPGYPEDRIACLEACAAECGVGPPTEITLADVACLRRALAGAPAECP